MVTAVTYDEIICTTSEVNAVTSATVDVTTAGCTVQSSSNFQYTDTGIGAVTSLSENALFTNGGDYHLVE